MQEITFQQFSEAFSKTNQSILHVLASEETSTTIRTITARQNASQYSSDIAAVVGYVMVGLVPVKNFIRILQEEAELDAETARRIAYDLRSQLFAPVAKELAAMQPASHDTSRADIHPARGHDGSRRAPAPNGIHPNNIVNLRE